MSHKDSDSDASSRDDIKAIADSLKQLTMAFNSLNEKVTSLYSELVKIKKRKEEASTEVPPSKEANKKTTPCMLGDSKQQAPQPI